MPTYPGKAHDELRRQYADFARSHLNHDISARSREGRFDSSAWKKCGELLIHGLPVPTCHGGRGLDALETVMALEGLGYGCEDGGLAFAIGAQLFACTVPIWLYGSEAQKAQYLPGLCRGEIIATNAMTEAEGGSAAFQMRCTGERKNDAYHLSGVKTYCANAPVSTLCLTYVLTDVSKGFTGGVTAFLLDRVKHGYLVCAEVDKLGLRTCTTGMIALNGVVAQESDALARPGGGGPIFNRSMEWERIGLSAINVGTMSRLLERAIGYARRRKPAGKSISRNQAISHPLADLQTDLQACRLMVYHAAAGLAEGRNLRDEASQTKLFVSERFKSMTLKLMQIYAGAGYEADSEIGRVLQDSIASTIYSGTSEIQRNIIARWMGC
ncbi:MAG: acyl-CoA/acyl-ACP dehydrogenase [Halioglobus sp.]|nr:acyl-CoA/acyl-ACP dehydrogenase [Halioglobus sp.]